MPRRIESTHWTVLVCRVHAQPKQLRAAANDRQGAANLVDDPGQETAHLDELPVEHGQADQMPVLDQPPHPGQDQFRRRILGHVVVRPGIQPGEHVRVVVAAR